MIKQKTSEAEKSLQCNWWSGHKQCQMLGGIAPNHGKYYCLWHYRALNDARHASDYERFLEWRINLINTYPYNNCLLSENDCSQRPKHPKCQWDTPDCPPKGSQWHYDAIAIWNKLQGG